MLIRDFNLDKLAETVWENFDQYVLDVENRDADISLAERLNFWTVTGIPNPDKQEEKEQ